MPIQQREQDTPARRLLLWLAEALVGLYVVLDDIFTPVFQPVVRWIVTFPLVLRLQKFAAGLPPYGILGLMAVPFVLGEPAKIYGLYLVTTGHWITGLVVLALAYFATLILVERLYAAGEAKLRTIRWFAYLMDWLIAVRDHLHEWAKSTQIWAEAEKFLRRMREVYAQAKQKARALVEWLRLRLRQG
jgi:hypothetical protein